MVAVPVPAGTPVVHPLVMRKVRCGSESGDTNQHEDPCPPRGSQHHLWTNSGPGRKPECPNGEGYRKGREEPTKSREPSFQVGDTPTVRVVAARRRGNQILYYVGVPQGHRSRDGRGNPQSADPIVKFSRLGHSSSAIAVAFAIAVNRESPPDCGPSDSSTSYVTCVDAAGRPVEPACGPMSPLGPGARPRRLSRRA